MTEKTLEVTFAVIQKFTTQHSASKIQRLQFPIPYQIMDSCEKAG
jgi:hypothetical protein